MSDRRVAWIRAQLDATEAAAKAAIDAAPTPWALRYDEYGDDRWLDIEAADGTAVVDTESGANGPPLEVAEHFSLHDPAAVLADVEAKRSILDEHQCVPAYDNSRYGHPAPKICSTCDHHEITGEWTLWPCKTVRLLAEGFRHRPGYAEACGE